MDGNGYETSREAGKRLGIDKTSVTRLCRQGKLPAVMVGGTWLVLKGGAPDDYLSPDEVADRMGVSVDAVRSLLRAGLLRGEKPHPHLWLVRREDVPQAVKL